MEAGHIIHISEFLQTVDLITDYAISDKEKIKMIENEVQKEYSRIGVKKIENDLTEQKGNNDSDAVEFAEWIATGFNKYYGGKWVCSSGRYVEKYKLLFDVQYTTADLYKLFKQSKL